MQGQSAFLCVSLLYLYALPMFKKPTKKQFIIRRVALATVATMSVLVIVTVSIFLMLGYRLDSGSGTLSQGALLQFDSQPNAATVSVNGIYMSARTPSKQTVMAGMHTVQMEKDRYETWNRTLTLEAGTLTWLDYTRLVPKERRVQEVARYEALAQLKISEDSKWALAHEKAESPVFQLVDLRSEAIKSSTITLPASLYAESATEDVTHSFTLVSWNENGRYAILTHSYNDQKEWIVLDTQDVNRSVNITQLLNVGFKDVQFAGTNGSVLFGLTDDGVIRKLDVSSGTISRGLVTHAQSFSIYDGTIISYVGTNPSLADERVTGIYRDGEERSHILYSTQDQEIPLFIKTSRYFSNDYVAIGHGENLTILKGSYPAASSDDTSSLEDSTTLTLPSALTSLSFSPKGDYVLGQAGAAFTSFELEHSRAAQSTQQVTEGQAVRPLRWLSTAQLWTDTSAAVSMRDFDGNYTHSIMAAETGYDAGLSQNGRFFYGVGRSDDGMQLQRVKMILD